MVPILINACEATILTLTVEQRVVVLVHERAGEAMRVTRGARRGNVSRGDPEEGEEGEQRENELHGGRQQAGAHTSDTLRQRHFIRDG